MAARMAEAGGYDPATLAVGAVLPGREHSSGASYVEIRDLEASEVVVLVNRA